jgi:formamidopyrimidine-DNA glycosylase
MPGKRRANVPELPEVETVVRELRPRLVGRRIRCVEAGPHPLRQPWSAAWDTLLRGRRIRDLSRRGKWIIAHLDRDLHLVLHLGMTGQLTVVPARATRLPHTHLIFHLDGGAQQWRFRDVRRFGSAVVIGNAEELRTFFASGGLGPEPFDLQPSYWSERLAGTRRCLKAILLDQRVVAGVGNIYADEALFEARLHPTKLGSAVTTRAAERLRRAVVAVLRRAIDKRGATIRDYIGGNGRKGGAQREFRVYGRTDEPCARCRRPIARIVLAGRSTHFCPRCQPLPR